MQITISETIVNTYREDMVLIKSVKAKKFILKADEGNVLRNKKTGIIYRDIVTVPDEKTKNLYEELPDPSLNV